MTQITSRKTPSPFAVAYRLRQPATAQAYAARAGVPEHQAAFLLRGEAALLEEQARQLAERRLVGPPLTAFEQRVKDHAAALRGWGLL